MPDGQKPAYVRSNSIPLGSPFSYCCHHEFRHDAEGPNSCPDAPSAEAAPEYPVIRCSPLYFCPAVVVSGGTGAATDLHGMHGACLCTMDSAIALVTDLLYSGMLHRAVRWDKPMTLIPVHGVILLKVPAADTGRFRHSVQYRINHAVDTPLCIHCR